MTLVTPDGAYGGPVRVAVNQTRALTEAGHEVTLAAAASGFKGKLPEVFDDVPIKLFRAVRAVPGAGFSGLCAPSLHSWLMRVSSRFDVLHIHMGRDFITLPSTAIARSKKVPFVLQTHGMVMPSGRKVAPLLDALLTRPALQNALKTFYLTDVERQGLGEVSGKAIALQELTNGVPLPPPSPAADPVPEVLFLARLHSRKRPLMFVEMAAELHEKFPTVKFSIVGPDEGEGDAVRAAIRRLGLSAVLQWEGSLEPSRVTDRLSRCAVYVLPSVDEPFPMTVLEAMALGKPVVVTDTCGLAKHVYEFGAGEVVTASLESLVQAVENLLSSPQKRVIAASNAAHLAHGRFSMAPIVAQLSSAYGEVISGRSGK